MSVKVACDVCRHIYHVPDERLKTEQKCRECTAVFKLVEFDEEAERKLMQPQGPSVLAQTLEWTKTGATSLLVLAVLGMLVSLLWVDPGGGSWAGSRNKASRNSYASQTPSNTYRPTNRTPQQNYRPPSYQPPTKTTTPNSNKPRPFPSTSHTPSVPKVDVNQIHQDAMKRANEAMQRMREQHGLPDLDSHPPNMPSHSIPAPRPIRPPGSSRNFGANNQIGPSSRNLSEQHWQMKYRGPHPVMPPSGKTVTSTNQLKPKQIVLVQHNAAWYPADVLSIQGDQVKIHYRGWSNSWDETVPLSRVQLAHDGFNSSQ